MTGSLTVGYLVKMQINFAFCMTILNCWYGTTENWQISWGISYQHQYSVAVTNGTSFSFLRTCSYLMLHYIKILNLVLYDLDWPFKLKTHWVAEESERLICEIYTKKKFTRFMWYSNCLQTYYPRPKKLLLFWKYFDFWLWLIEYSVVLF